MYAREAVSKAAPPERLREVYPVIIAAAMSAAAIQSTTTQEGGHQRLLAANWRRDAPGRTCAETGLVSSKRREAWRNLQDQA